CAALSCITRNLLRTLVKVYDRLDRLPTAWHKASFTGPNRGATFSLQNPDRLALVGERARRRTDVRRWRAALAAAAGRCQSSRARRGRLAAIPRCGRLYLLAAHPARSQPGRRIAAQGVAQRLARRHA